MPQTSVDIIDETYIRADPFDIRAHFDDERRLAQIWPHLALELSRDRGVKGLRSGMARSSITTCAVPLPAPRPRI